MSISSKNTPTETSRTVLGRGLARLTHKINHPRFHLVYSETPLSIWIWNFLCTLPPLLVSRNPVPCSSRSGSSRQLALPSPGRAHQACTLPGSVGLSLQAPLWLSLFPQPPFTHTTQLAAFLGQQDDSVPVSLPRFLHHPPTPTLSRLELQSRNLGWSLHHWGNCVSPTPEYGPILFSSASLARWGGGGRKGLLGRL